MTGKETPIFNRTYDFLTWLLPASNNFPRAHRHSFTRRLLDAAFDLRERLEEANYRKGRARLERLTRADEALAKVRLYLRLAARWGWLTEGQYQHAAQMVAEIGRLRSGLFSSKIIALKCHSDPERSRRGRIHAKSLLRLRSGQVWK